MAKQVINVGTSPRDRSGDKLRDAFIKVNSNFDELYAANNSGGAEEIDRSWAEANTGLVYDTVEWNSGKRIEIGVTPTEFANAVTYDSRTDSNQIYLEWDENFISTVWEGNPEGVGYEISLDGGTTWYVVETSGYSGQTFFYFAVPFENEGLYTFTYTIGDPVLIRFNRGSLGDIWFDLQNSPVDANTVLAVTVDFVCDIEMEFSNSSIETATIFVKNYGFTNALYNSNTQEGDDFEVFQQYIGSFSVKEGVDAVLRKNLEQADSGRIHGNFDNGTIGFMTYYWNAKLFTRT